MFVAAAHGKKACPHGGHSKEYYVVFSAAEPGEKATENGAVIWEKIEGKQQLTRLYHIPTGSPGAYPDAWAAVEKWRTSAELDKWEVLSEEDTIRLAEQHSELFTIPEVYALREKACKQSVGTY